MTVKYTPEEVSRIPVELHPLMQQFPISFDNLFEIIDLGVIDEPIHSKDIYFDDELQPAIGLRADGEVLATESTEQPKVITVFVNNKCVFVQVLGQVLADRIQDKSVLFA
jgi:hypothetical protein